MSKQDKMINAEEIVDKLKECILLVEPNLEQGSMKLRDAVDLVSDNPELFAEAYLQYVGTDSMEDLIETFRETWKEKGCHK